jgi:hypothetical protein
MKLLRACPWAFKLGRVGVVAGAAATAAALAGVPAAAWSVHPPRPTELRVAWVDLCRTAPDLQQAARDEVKALLEPAGIRVAARAATPGLDEPTGGAFVVLLPSDPAHRGRGHRSAGASRREASGQATVWAFPPNVATALGLRWELEPLWSPVERRLFARALGAVVVHELAHVFAGAPHRKTGVMSDQLRAQWVSDPSMALDADLHAALRDGVASRDDGGPSPGARVASGR